MRFLLAVSLVTMWCALCLSDTIILKDGRQIQGRVIGRSGDKTGVKVDGGKLEIIPTDDIKEVIPSDKPKRADKPKSGPPVEDNEGSKTVEDVKIALPDARTKENPLLAELKSKMREYDVLLGRLYSVKKPRGKACSTTTAPFWAMRGDRAVMVSKKFYDKGSYKTRRPLLKRLDELEKEIAVINEKLKLESGEAQRLTRDQVLTWSLESFVKEGVVRKWGKTWQYTHSTGNAKYYRMPVEYVSKAGLVVVGYLYVGVGYTRETENYYLSDYYCRNR